GTMVWLEQGCVARALRCRRRCNRFQLNGVCACDQMAERRVSGDGYRVTRRLRAFSACNRALVGWASGYRYGGRARNEQIRRDDVGAVESGCFARELPQGSFNTATINFGCVTNDGDLVVELSGRGNGRDSRWRESDLLPLCNFCNRRDLKLEAIPMHARQRSRRFLCNQHIADDAGECVGRRAPNFLLSRIDAVEIFVGRDDDYVFRIQVKVIRRRNALSIDRVNQALLLRARENLS